MNNYEEPEYLDSLVNANNKFVNYIYSNNLC